MTERLHFTYVPGITLNVGPAVVREGFLEEMHSETPKKVEIGWAVLAMGRGGRQG